MKRKATTLLTIILTTTFLYNVAGIYLLVSLQKEQVWITLMKQIPDSQFKVINLNASLYSYTEDTDMEYVNENFTIINVTYHIFKKRIHDNIISLYYLRNKQQDGNILKLEKIAENQSYDSNTTSKTPLKRLVKSSLNDFLFENSYVIKSSFFIQTDLNRSNMEPKNGLHSGYSSLSYTPPKMA
ncbi:hypothetical protein [Flavobacterium cellulosilyticum]|uniref:Uncharacterized protein n=1 Tax=Flavobacterium cellulosilyticum TaxID=2541731 RepID=A0A4R5CE89_9FLAO|nr:hypothetical protein [Flavobacterium cellulosilyticum]TDD96573.1 hypothetical protein E0F76_11225 [Flavobacterium cellulosilyticum]